MPQTNKSYPIHQCVFYKVESRKRLESILHISETGLKTVLSEIGYRVTEHPKKGGRGTRTITAPNRKIKRVQSRVLYLLSGIQKPDWVISSTRGKCHIDNARFHVESLHVLTMDISSFFDNCRRNYVYAFFREKLKMSPDCSKALTDICTWNNGIPTGTPTSQLLAYFVYEDMFKELNALALSRNCIFSLYVDDMTFSSNQDMSPDGLANDVRLILRKYDHRAKNSKTHYYPASRHKLITGVSISPKNMLEVGNSLQERVFTGFEKLLEEPSVMMQQRVLGQIQASRLVEKSKFPEIERQVRALQPSPNDRLN